MRAIGSSPLRSNTVAAEVVERRSSLGAPPTCGQCGRKRRFASTSIWIEQRPSKLPGDRSRDVGGERGGCAPRVRGVEPGRPRRLVGDGSPRRRVVLWSSPPDGGGGCGA